MQTDTDDDNGLQMAESETNHNMTFNVNVVAWMAASVNATLAPPSSIERSDSRAKNEGYFDLEHNKWCWTIAPDVPGCSCWCRARFITCYNRSLMRTVEIAALSHNDCHGSSNRLWQTGARSLNGFATARQLVTTQTHARGDCLPVLQSLDYRNMCGVAVAAAAAGNERRMRKKCTL